MFSTFFRLFRVNDLLGFYYDQGRDALRIQDILTLRNLPAIGPETGISGLFLGPFWYYLLAPFYFLGQGNPVLPAGFVSLLEAGTVFLVYWFGKEFYDRQVGLLAAFFWAFSYQLVRLTRWFNNPSPAPFFSVLLLYGLGKFFLRRKEKYLLLVAFSLAVSLQLEIASAVFFLPVIAVLWLIFRVKLRKKSYFFGAIMIFAAFLVPQLLFEIKNKFLMTRNFFSFTGGEISTEDRTWAIPQWWMVEGRLSFYFESFLSKLEEHAGVSTKVLTLLWLIFTANLLRKQKTRSVTLMLVIFLCLPLFCLLFFVGNYGRLYDYQLTGFFPAFILLFAVFVVFFWKIKLYRPIFVIIIGWFLLSNLLPLRYTLTANVDGPTHISLGNQLQAIDWIYQDANGKEFNVDVYVPPVIPYAYDYLIPWRGKKVYNQQPVEEQVPLLYTLAEADPPHPERLEAWLKRQKGIGKVIKSQKFGGITIEQRERILP